MLVQIRRQSLKYQKYFSERRTSNFVCRLTIIEIADDKAKLNLLGSTRLYLNQYLNSLIRSKHKHKKHQTYEP